MTDEGFTENKAALIIKQILLAISFISQRRIAHGEMRPENLMINDLINSQNYVQMQI